MARTRPLQPTKVELQTLKMRLRAEGESFCDDPAVSTLGNRVEDGRALWNIEKLFGRAAVLAVGAADGSLSARVPRIAGLRPGRVNNSPWPVLRFAFGFLGAVLAISVFSFHESARPPKDAVKPAVGDSLFVATKDFLVAIREGLVNADASISVTMEPNAPSAPTLQPAPPAPNELDLLLEKFKLALPRNWEVYRQGRAFEFRGPNGPTEESKSEQARITLWFSNLFYSSRTLQQRDPQLPRVITWGNTRLGKVLSTRNQSAIEHWPEFGEVLYWLLPVEHVAIVGVVDLYQKIDGQDSLIDLIHASGSVIDLRIDDDGRRVHNRSRALGEYGISPKTDLVILGELPETRDASTEQEKEISHRHQTNFKLATKGAGEYGVRIASLEDYIAYLRKLKQDGRINRLKESKDGDGILIPEVPVPLAAQVASEPDELPIVYEGIIEDVLDGILLFADGRGIMTGRSTKYARLTEAGEIHAQRVDLKYRTRVRYEVVPGVGATKVVILSDRQEGSQHSNTPTDAPRKTLLPHSLNKAHQNGVMSSTACEPVSFPYGVR